MRPVVRTDSSGTRGGALLAAYAGAGHLLQEEPTIVHFSGHGGGAVGLVLHSEDKAEVRLVDAAALSHLFGLFSDRVRIVVLNACYSEVQALAIARSIDFVVGMNDTIGDEAAIAFAAAFYRGLAFNQSVKTAYDLGVSELMLTGMANQADIPRLHCREGVDPERVRLFA